MKALFQIAAYGDDTYTNKKTNRVVTEKLATLVEVKEAGAIGTQFFEFKPKEDEQKQLGDKPAGKRIEVEIDEIGAVFANKPRISKGRLVRVDGQAAK